MGLSDSELFLLWLKALQCRPKRAGAMSEKAAKRQRRTNQLVRVAADYVFAQKKVVPDQLYGLCKLTWITDSYEGPDAAYVRSTKKPALGEIFKQGYSALGIVQVGADEARIVGCRGTTREH
jgi:hypothetical protein